MSKLLARIVVLLLVSCLIVDPVTAFAFCGDPASRFSTHMDRRGYFGAEALQLADPFFQKILQIHQALGGGLFVRMIPERNHVPVQPRFPNGRFAEKPGGNWKAALEIILENLSLRSAAESCVLTVQHYSQYVMGISERTMRRDFEQLVALDYLIPDETQRPVRFRLGLAAQSAMGLPDDPLWIEKHSFPAILRRHFGDRKEIAVADLDTWQGDFLRDVAKVFHLTGYATDMVGTEEIRKVKPHRKNILYMNVRNASEREQQYRLKAGSKDFVSINNILYVPEETVRVANELLKPGGMMVVTFHVDDKSSLPKVKEVLSELGYEVHERPMPAGYPHSIKYQEQEKILIALKPAATSAPEQSSYWDRRWLPPSKEEIEAAHEVLNDLSVEHHARGGTRFIIAATTDLIEANPARVLRAIYFLVPELAGAILASIGIGFHTEMANLLMPNPDEHAPIEPEMIAAIVNTGLHLIDQYTEPVSNGIFIKGYPRFKNREIPFDYDLVGIAVLLGTLRADWAFQVFARLDVDTLPGLIHKMFQVIDKRSHLLSKQVLEQIDVLLASLSLERYEQTAPSLSEDVRIRLRTTIEEARKNQVIPQALPVTHRLFRFGTPELADGSAGMRSVLGNKGAQLAEMTNIGLPVPPGFTLPDSETTEIQKAGGVPEDLKDLITKEIEYLERKVDHEMHEPLHFGDPQHLLLLAVRSGANESRPGKYFTVTDVGLHRSTLAAYEALLGNPYQARMDYLRHIAIYAHNVDDRDKNRDLVYLFTSCKFFPDYKAGRYSELPKLGTLQELDALIGQAEKLYQQLTGRAFPTPMDQLFESINAIAQFYPKETEGKGVTIQWQVLGNVDDGKSLSGVLFTRNPFNGEKELMGAYRYAAKGSDIVQPYSSTLGFQGPSLRNDIVMHYSDLGKTDPQLYGQLVKDVNLLERHYHSIEDVELVVSKGHLYFVQTRDNLNATTPLAQARILVDLATEGLLSEGEALQRIDIQELEWLKHYFEQQVISKTVQGDAVAIGVPLFPGIVRGELVVDVPDPDHIKKGAIYAIDQPFELYGRIPRYGRVFDEDIGAIMTSKGGYADHAAVEIRAKNKHIPYVLFQRMKVESRKWITLGGAQINEGENIVLDGNNGRIYRDLPPEAFEDSEITKVLKGLLKPDESQLFPYYRTVLRWLDLKKGPANPAVSAVASEEPLRNARVRVTNPLLPLRRLPRKPQNTKTSASGVKSGDLSQLSPFDKRVLRLYSHGLELKGIMFELDSTDARVRKSLYTIDKVLGLKKGSSRPKRLREMYCRELVVVPKTTVTALRDIVGRLNPLYVDALMAVKADCTSVEAIARRLDKNISRINFYIAAVMVALHDVPPNTFKGYDMDFWLAANILAAAGVPLKVQKETPAKVQKEVPAEQNLIQSFVFKRAKDLWQPRDLAPLWQIASNGSGVFYLGMRVTLEKLKLIVNRSGLRIDRQNNRNEWTENPISAIEHLFQENQSSPLANFLMIVLELNRARIAGMGLSKADSLKAEIIQRVYALRRPRGHFMDITTAIRRSA